MIPLMTDDELDEQLRELFGSFEVCAVDPVTSRAKAAQQRLARGAVFAWAGALAVLIAIASTMSFVYVHAHSADMPGPVTTKVGTGKAAHQPQSPYRSAFMSVLPGTDLHGGETVSVHLHATPNTGFWLSECASLEATSPKGCGPASGFEFASTDSTGDATIRFQVLRTAATVYGGRPATSCTSQCVIDASTGTVFLSATNISFAPITAPTFKPGYPAPDCTFSHLSIHWSPGASGGHDSLLLTFENTGASICSLYGYPGVAGLDAAGMQVVQARRTLNGWVGGVALNQKAQTVILAKGEFASAIVEGTDVPVNNDNSLCHTYPKLLITPPNTTRSVVEDDKFGSCSGIQVHPVVAGTTGSTPNL
jgi:Domain of unknown function (DUF4232)